MNGIGATLIYAMAAILAVIAVARRDRSFHAGIVRAIEQITVLVPRMILALVAAGFMVKLIPSELIARYLGEGAGLSAILIASVAGMLVPAGPVTSFALAAAFANEGASTPALISFLSGWSVFAAHRVVIFELPLLGIAFLRMRILSVIVLPPLAGSLALFVTRLGGQASG